LVEEDMEKNSSVVLTKDEVEQVKAGKIPMRIAATWGFTLEELTAIINAGTYTVTSWEASLPGSEGFNL
jgi:hypothetical protein